MDYYIDIQVLPDPEFEVTVLMNALFAKCHRILGQLGDGEVGVSFPGYKKNLGSILRLHSSEAKLNQLMAEPWLKGLNDYTKKTSILPVPQSVRYRTVTRIQSKSADNKRKRSVKKGWLSESEAAEKFASVNDHFIKLPYAQLTSLSNKNRYQVYIKHGELMDQAAMGRFNSYGLSREATVPWF